MSREKISFALTIDGCPYIAASDGCPPNPDYDDFDWPLGAIVLPGTLSREKLRSLQWSEELKPATAETSVSSIALTLEDVIAATGPAASQRVWSWLFSRKQRSIPRALLAMPGLTSASEFTVHSDAGFSSGEQIVWIDREAIRCQSFDSITKKFTVAPGGRAHLGTRFENHVPLPEQAFAPFVWAALPNPQRRRVILWLVRGWYASPVWRGYIGRAPRLDSDGARWELQLDHAWQVHQNRPLGPTKSTLWTYGFQPGSFKISVEKDVRPVGFEGYVSAPDSEAATTVWAESVEQFVSPLVAALNARIQAPTSGFSGNVHHSIVDGRPRFDTDLTARHQITCGPSFAMSELGARERSTEHGASVHHASVTAPYPMRAHIVLQPGMSTELLVESLAGVPTGALSTAFVDGRCETRVQWAVEGQSGDANNPFHVVIESVDMVRRVITGVANRAAVPAASGDVVVVGIAGPLLLTQPTALKLVTRIESGHWLYALRHGILSGSYDLDNQADSRDWSWERMGDVVGATGAPDSSARVWVLDGNSKMGDFVKNACRMDSCAVAPRRSRLAVIPVSPPLDSEPTNYSIDLTSGDGLLHSKSGFATQPEGVVNVVKLTLDGADGYSLTVQNQGSVALYGVSAPLEVEVKDSLVSVLGDQPPADLARGPLSRILGLWSDPTELLTIDVPMSSLDQVEIGAIIEVRSASLPDGEGHRGQPSSRRGRCIARTIELSRGAIRLSVLVFSHRVSGYAPAARVGSIAFENHRVTLAVDYLTDSSTARDYAGSNLPEYAGRSGDGGAGLFSIGAIVRFRQIDTTTVVEEGGFKVLAVDDVARTIDLDSSPSAGAVDWTALVALGATVDIVADHYDVATPQQRKYSYVGSKASGTLEGDPLKEWAP